MKRAVLEAISKALVAVAVMLSIVVVVQGPIEASYARKFTALLLAAGTVGLVVLRLSKQGSRR